MDFWGKGDQHRLPSLDEVCIGRLCELGGRGRLPESLSSEFLRRSLSSMDTNVIIGLVELLVCIDSALLRLLELDGVVEVDLVSRQFCFDRKLSVLKNCAFVHALVRSLLIHRDFPDVIDQIWISRAEKAADKAKHTVEVVDKARQACD
jgi:hypothetical protein